MTAGAATVLELCPSRAGAARLGRLAGIVPLRQARRVAMAWHDDGRSSLRAGGVAICEQDGAWRLERLAPGPDDRSAASWVPGAPPPVLAEAITAARLGVATSGMAEVARFTGREHAYTLDGLDGVRATLLHGAVTSGDARESASRLRLTGPAPEVEAAADRLGEVLGLTVPRGGLAAGILGIAPASPEAGPATGTSVAEFVAAALPSLVWPVLLGTAALAAENSAERVHETRVAVRRLRSVLGVMRRPTACAATESLRPLLHALAGRLGAARDWDVFLGGVGARLAEVQEGEDTARLLAAAQRQRSAGYGALRAALAGPGQRALERQLACIAALRPWERAGPEQAALLAGGAAPFAAEVLRKRLHRMRRAGQGFKHLAPEALHAVRKDGKRLRYAAETFAPLFPGAASRRFLKRLRAIQGALGELAGRGGRARPPSTAWQRRPRLRRWPRGGPGEGARRNAAGRGARGMAAIHPRGRVLDVGPGRSRLRGRRRLR